MNRHTQKRDDCEPRTATGLQQQNGVSTYSVDGTPIDTKDVWLRFKNGHLQGRLRGQRRFYRMKFIGYMHSVRWYMLNGHIVELEKPILK
jgi:hypothetical protein